MDTTEFKEYTEHLVGGRVCATGQSAGEDSCGPPGTPSPEESTLPEPDLGATFLPSPPLD